MKLSLLVVAIALFYLPSVSQSYKKIHFKSILIDTHNDIPTTAIDKGVSFDQNLKNKTHSDLQRMKEGGVDAQLFSIWCDGNKENPYAWANREIDTVLAWTNRNPDKMVQAFTTKDIKKAAKQKKLGVLFGVEGGHMIEGKLIGVLALAGKVTNGSNVVVDCKVDNDYNFFVRSMVGKMYHIDKFNIDDQGIFIKTTKPEESYNF